MHMIPTSDADARAESAAKRLLQQLRDGAAHAERRGAFKSLDLDRLRGLLHFVDVPIQQPCVCSIDTLMSSGCRCGGR